MDRPNVFLSYHFDADSGRADIVRKLGIVHAPAPETVESWGEMRRDVARLRAWVEASLKHRDALVVLVGARTWARPLIRFEVERAVALDLPILGIRVHNILPQGALRNARGLNPFKRMALTDAWGNPFPRKLVDPASEDPVSDIRENLVHWLALAWQSQKRHTRRRSQHTTA